MVKKAKPTPKPVPPAKPVETWPSLAERITNLETAVQNIITMVQHLRGQCEELGKRVRFPAGLNAGAPREEVTPWPPGEQGFLASQWYRRDGDSYSSSALPGSPNAGPQTTTTYTRDPDNPSRVVRSTDERDDRHKGGRKGSR